MIKAFSLLSSLASITLPTQLVVSNLSSNKHLEQLNTTYEIKSNYAYHSAIPAVSFNDTVLVTTIYKEVDKILDEQAKTGVPKNISISEILWKIDPNSYVTFSNYETIIDDVNQYISLGQVNPSFYDNLQLWGREWYSWDWGKACPSYTWDWSYDKKDSHEIKLFTYHNYGYGNADHPIHFKFDINYS